MHGATSALTLAATQLAIAAGARVLVTAASEEKCAVAQKLGAAATTTNREANITDWVMMQTDGQGVDMVLDHVGPALWEASLFALAPRGRLVTCGNTTGDNVSIPSLGFLFQRGVQILGSDAYFSTDFAAVWQQYCNGIQRGHFSPEILKTFAIEDGAQAHRLLESGEATGRLVLEHAP
jgi:NADPH:quinone reductase-like Zn-dependent oxidoreductase